MAKVRDFSLQPITYSADMVFPYPWNKPKPNHYYKSDIEIEKPLTREQIVQGQAILRDIETLPRVLRYRYQKYYEKLLHEKGLRKAHDYLYFRFHQQIWPRLSAINSRYEMETKTLLTFSARFDIEVSHFNRLFDLYDKSIKQLAEAFAAGFFNLYEIYCDKFTEQNNGDRDVIYQDPIQTDIYGRLVELTKGLHIIPLHYQAYCRALKNRKKGKGKQHLEVHKVIAAVQRLTNADYWHRKLKAHRTQWLEALMIANMDVCKDRHPYASKQAVRAVQTQRLSNMQYLQGMDIEDVETGERFDLFDKVMASVSNPEIRRMELMSQMAGIERVAKERGDIGMFVTMTCPSKYHPTKLRNRKKDVIAVLNSKWKEEAYTPKDGQHYLVKVWSRIRSAFNDNNIDVYGVRVVEPHHDGTPHWHMLLFVDKASRAKAIEIMRKRALKEDGDEPGAHKYRFECKHMNRGGAVGYIAKYIAKNIDGYALDGEIDHETGKDLKSMAAAVTAWASTWRIPQFQFYKLPSKGAYRECRRLPRGISIADQLGDVAERVRAAADGGDFFEYVMSQGGPCIRRKEETIRVAREISDVNVYGEDVQKVVGIYNQLIANKPTLKTRERQYKIVKKNTDAAGDGLLKSAIGAPRSPVNNCRFNISEVTEYPVNEPLKPTTGAPILPLEEENAGLNPNDVRPISETHTEEIKKRGCSHIVLSEKEQALRETVRQFFDSKGFELTHDTLIDMFIKGMRVSDGLYTYWYDGERLRERLNQQPNQPQKLRAGTEKLTDADRIAAVLARVNKRDK